MIVFFLNISFIILFIMYFYIDKESLRHGTEIAISDLLFRTCMLKPDSKLHFIFIRKNRWNNYLHIKQHAAILIVFWLSSIANTVLSSLFLYYDQLGQNRGDLLYAIFVIIAFFIMVLFSIEDYLRYKSVVCQYKQSKMTEMECYNLRVEISNLIPHFYD